jgi:transcriptional regulator with XRE-family HTH domain
MFDFKQFISDEKSSFDFPSQKLVLGQRLKQIRKDKNLSMEKIVELYPITRPTITKLEKGEGTINSLLIYLTAIGESTQFFDSFFANYRSQKEFIKNIDPKFRNEFK